MSVFGLKNVIYTSFGEAGPPLDGKVLFKGFIDDDGVNLDHSALIKVIEKSLE